MPRVPDRLNNWQKPFLFRIVLAHTVAMGRPPLKIEVSQKDQKQLAKIVRGGVQQAFRPHRSPVAAGRKAVRTPPTRLPSWRYSRH